MKKLIFLIFIITSCGSKITKFDERLNERSGSINYFVYKINSIDNYYLIYASKKDSLYKIVSKKENEISDCNKIKLNHYYKFNLHSRRENAPTIGGIKLAPVNYLSITCYTYEKDTKICIDTQNGIFDLYYADNIKGLCLTNN